MAVMFLTGCTERPSFTKFEEAVLSVTGEVVQLFKERADEIWPGYDLSEQVFVVYIPDKLVLAVNYDQET